MADRAAMEAALRQGAGRLSERQLAEQIGCSRRAVRRAAERLGIDLRLSEDELSSRRPHGEHRTASTARRVLEVLGDRGLRREYDLRPEQRELIEALLAGRTVTEIARQQGVRPSAVSNRLGRILRELERPAK